MVMLRKELFAKIQEFVVSGSRLLYSFIEKGEKIPHTITEKYKVENSGSWSMTHVRQPLIIDLILRHEKDLSNLPEFKDCVSLMQAEPQVSKHLDKLIGLEGGPRFRRTIWDFLRYFLSPMFEKYLQESKFDQQLLKRLYSDFEDFVCSDQIAVRDSAYLDNFASDVDIIDVEKELDIRKLTNEELERLLQASKWGAPSAFFHVKPPKYVIETAYTKRKVVGEHIEPQPSDSAKRLYQLVTALRLFKSGVVGFNEITTTAETPFLWGYTKFNIARKTFIGQKYILNKTEAIQFKDFWKRFSIFSTSKPKRLAIAIRRFENAYERTNLQDKLIDFMIAYEALVFKQGETGEFRHKLSTRVSKLLSKTYEERKRIAKEITKFYDKRSRIVHGEEVKLPRGFVEKVENYLRGSIKTLIERLPGQDYDEIILRLDLD